VRSCSRRSQISKARKKRDSAGSHDIDTLLFVGFVANFCVLDSSGGIRDVATRFSYRTILLTGATAAHEFPDTVEGEKMEFFVARQVQYRFGFTASAGYLLRSLESR